VQLTELQHYTGEDFNCFILCLQRDPLEEQFNELYADISNEMQDQLDTSYESGTNAAENEGDKDIVVEEYVSDDETLTSSSDTKDSEDYDLGDHVTKVSSLIDTLFLLNASFTVHCFFVICTRYLCWIVDEIKIFI